MCVLSEEMYRYFKRFIDIVCSLVGCVILAILYPFIALAIKLNSPGPVVYRRKVLGKNGRSFEAYKFRSMVANAEQLLLKNARLKRQFDESYKLKDDPRITTVGNFIRKTSIDEFPQLINVLKGEMSLIGPRMIAPDELPRYGEWGEERLTVKPGLTGLWQVSGRQETKYEDRIKFDIYYVRNLSFGIDLKILLKTIPVVIGMKGAH